jgi:regulator of protease activity HflC (stomatin/prohibitin superfamily)
MITNMSLSPTTIAMIVVGAIIILILLTRCTNILRQYERGVVFRLGKAMRDEKGPGFVFIFWPIDQLVKVSLRVVTWDVPPQDVITRDNVSLKVNAVVYFLVTNASKAIIAVENFRYAVEQAAQTGLRSVLGEVELDDLLAERAKLNARLQAILDEQTEMWGVKVTQVQVKQVDLPQEMQRAIAAQAEAERTRRAKIIGAQGEFQAATKLAEAAAVLDREPISVTLRYLQTLIEIGTEQNTTSCSHCRWTCLARLGTGSPSEGEQPRPGRPVPERTDGLTVTETDRVRTTHREMRVAKATERVTQLLVAGHRPPTDPANR